MSDDGSQVDRVARTIAGRIADGHLSADQRLPSIRAMAADSGVSRDTVQRAYDRLVAGGRIYARRGAGFYVAAPVPASPRDMPAHPVASLEPFQLVHSPLPLDRTPGSGVLRHEDGAMDEVSRVLKAAVSGAHRPGRYGDLAGYLPLRRELQNKLLIEGVEAPLPSIMTVPGCVAGISLIVRAFVRAPAIVLIEEPSSFVHVALLMAHGAEVMRVPRLADGPDLEVLHLLCERHRPTMFLMSSLLHNPTGGSIPLHKARKLLEIAAEFDMLIVDDAGFADLAPTAGRGPVAPLLVLDQLERVIHVGGSSRVLGPEVGPGYIVAGERRMNALRLFRPVQGLGNMLIQERVFFRFLHEGLYRRRCERLRGYLARRTAATRDLFAGTPVTFAPSGGGMFLWADLGRGVDAVQVAKRMLARGYLSAPGRHFLTPRVDHSTMRFNVTTTTAGAVAALVAAL